MGLCGKLVRQIEVKSHGDLFHQLFRHDPHHLSNISPANVQGVDLHEGDSGAVGAVTVWNYTHEGKPQTARAIIDAIDEEDKSVRFRLIDGDACEHYKFLTSTLHVITKDESNLVTWTLEYEKQDESVADPNTLMDFCMDICKDIDTHHSN